MKLKLLQNQKQQLAISRFWNTKLALLQCIYILSFLTAQAQNPDLKWVKTASGVFVEQARSNAVDAAGNIYTTGYFQDTVDFDPNIGVFNLTSSAGNLDIFITKIDSLGNLIWAKAIGNTGADVAYSIAVSAASNVYITGYFTGTVDFDPNAGTSNLTAAGAQDIFVTLLDTNGNLEWAKAIGGIATDQGNSIATDAFGSVYITGTFPGTADFDPNAGVFNLTSAGGFDIFVSKLNASGNLVWAKQMGSTGTDIGQGISTEASGNVYTTGYFQNTVDFDPNAGISNLTSAGGNDIFVSKLDATGNLSWAKKMGNTSGDAGNSITTDAAGNVYTTGYFSGITDFDPNSGVFNLTSLGGFDIFISKLDVSGNFVWAKAMGGSTADIGYCTVLDADGNLYTTGYFQGTVDFDPNVGVANLTTVGNQDIFVCKLSASGNLVWAKSIGGTLNDVGYGIAIDGLNNVYTTGYFQGTVDFDPNAGISNVIASGNQDIFIQKMNVDGIALNFDGINDRVIIPNQPVSNLTNFTIEAWVYSTDSSTYQTIYAEGNIANDNPMFSLTKLNGTSGFEIVLRNTAGIGLVVSGSAGNIPLNTWTHVAFARISATEARLYINGLNTDYFVFTSPETIATNVTNIGVRQRVGFDGYLIGNLDEVRLWNRALPQGEIANNIYCELASGQTGLVSYYKFNQGIDSVNNSTLTTLTDASGNNNNGTLTNFALSGSTSNWVAPGGINSGSTCSSFLSNSNFEFTSNLSVYPNPSRDIFSINCHARGNIIVYDLMGKIIKTESLELGITKVDLSNYPNGIYLMKVTYDSNQTKTIKLMKQ